MTSLPQGTPAHTDRVPTMSALKKLALACAAFLVAALACELGLRAWKAVKGKPYSASATRAEIEGMLDPLRDFVPGGSERPDNAPGANLIPILHPYTGAESWHDTGDVLKYFREPHSTGDYVILVIGGSVAAFFGASAPERLIELLSADPHLAGRKITVLNYAHASYKQPQQLNRITYLLALGAKFDAVIDIDGFNEVALALENAHTATNPLYPSPPIWALAASKVGNGSRMRPEIVAQLVGLRDDARSTIERALRWKFSSSCILGTWTLRRLNGITRQRAEVQQTLFASDGTKPVNRRMLRQTTGPVFPSDEAERMQMCVTAWFEGSISLAAECHARGILFLHVLQPALGDTDSKPLTDAEKAIVPPDADWMDGPRIGYPLLRERGQELTRRGVAFLDTTRAFADVERTLYADPCHFDPAGNLILAEKIAPAFRALLATR